MKYAVIGIIALVVLGGAAFAVYELTDWFDQGEEWWDEKRLENFPAHAAREVEDMEKRLDELKATRTDLQTDKALLQGGEKMGDSNFSNAGTGFLTLYGYDKRIPAYTAAGESLAASYKKAAAGSGVMDGDSGAKELPADTMIAVDFTQPKTNRRVAESLTAENVLELLDEIDADLSQLEYERNLVDETIKQYDGVIAEVDETIKAQEQAIKEFKQEVKKIEAELKMIKVKEDLAEINKAIAGEDSNSNLGKLIAQYEAKKKDFGARQMVAEGETKKTKSLDDLGKPSAGGSKGSNNRFLK